MEYKKSIKDSRDWLDRLLKVTGKNDICLTPEQFIDLLNDGAYELSLNNEPYIREGDDEVAGYTIYSHSAFYNGTLIKAQTFDPIYNHGDMT
jgi:hypothetical protein